MDSSAVPSSFSPPPILTQSGVCQLLGTLLNVLLSGSIIVQFHSYCVTFPDDRLPLKALITFVFILELVQAIMLSEHIIRTFGANFGNFGAIIQVGTAWFSVPFLSACVSGTVQLFLIHRIYAFSSARLITFFLVLLSLAHTASGFTVAVFGRSTGDFSKFQQNYSVKVTGTIWVCTGAVSDILIAGFLSFYLSRLRTGFKKTETLLNKMIKLTIETGTLTATIQLTMTILFLAFSDKPYYLTLAFCLSKVYGLNILMIQNSRASVLGPASPATSNPSSSSNGGSGRTRHTGLVSIPMNITGDGPMGPSYGADSKPMGRGSQKASSTVIPISTIPEVV